MKSVIFRLIPIKFCLNSLLLGAVFLISGAVQAQHNTWGKIINPAARFQSLANFNNEAVLDKETGLIWQQCPSAIAPGTWANRVDLCHIASTGGRYGWRLPTIEEALSLATAGNPNLPNSDPFCPGTAGSYWTGTTAAGNISSAYLFESPYDVDESPAAISPKTGLFRHWCVRGGQANDSGQ